MLQSEVKAAVAEAVSESALPRLEKGARIDQLKSFWESASREEREQFAASTAERTVRQVAETK